jgi:hypothetical protein
MPGGAIVTDMSCKLTSPAMSATFSPGSYVYGMSGSSFGGAINVIPGPGRRH